MDRIDSNVPCERNVSSAGTNACRRIYWGVAGFEARSDRISVTAEPANPGTPRAHYTYFVAELVARRDAYNVVCF